MEKVDGRLPEKGNSNSRGARPLHRIITMIKWIWTSRLSIRTLSLSDGTDTLRDADNLIDAPDRESLHC